MCETTTGIPPPQNAPNSLPASRQEAAGLVIVAVFYPSGDLAPIWLLLSLGAALGVFFLAICLSRHTDRGNQARPNSTHVRKSFGFWPYLVAGCASTRIIDLVVIGCVAATGFTVSLFVASVAFDPGPVQDAAKMGALFSFSAAAISIAAGKLFRVEKHSL